MKFGIELIIWLACLMVVLKLYKKQPQTHLFVTLIALGLIALTKGILPLIEQEAIRYGVVIVALIGCVWSYYLIQKQEDK